MNTQSKSQGATSQQGTLLRKVCFSVAMALAMPLAYANEPLTYVHCESGDDLHTAIANATGGILLITGTCYANGTPFTINKNLVLEGASPTTAILDGRNSNNLTVGGVPVVWVKSGNTVTLDSLTIQNGQADGSLGNNNEVLAGGVTNDGNLSIIQTNVSNNNGANIAAGGIENAGAALTIQQSLINGNNTAYSNSGGNGGSGSGNHYNGSGLNIDSGDINISQSTFTGNSGQFGGAIEVLEFVTGHIVINANTISNNTVTGGDGGVGAGIDIAGLPLAISINQSIVTNNINTAVVGSQLDVDYLQGIGSSHISISIDAYSKIGVLSSDLGQTLTNGPKVLFVSVTNPANNTTSTLADWGGPTMTMKPDATQAGGNPAIKVVPISSTDVNNVTTHPCADLAAFDQRGAKRPGVGKPACDVGAYETGDPQISLIMPSTIVSPATYLTLPFGTVNMGNSPTMMAEVQNTGNDVLQISSANVSAVTNPLTFSLTSVSPLTPLPVSLPILKSEDFNIQYTPVANETDIGLLAINSNDPAMNVLDVSLLGTGANFVMSPIQQIQDILNLLKADYPATLAGEGPGKSAPNRFNAFNNMIVSAGSEINTGDYADACSQLKDAAAKVDVPQNASKNSNFFVGNAGDNTTEASKLYGDITTFIGDFCS